MNRRDGESDDMTHDSGHVSSRVKFQRVASARHQVAAQGLSLVG